jgi:plastocyanin
MSIPIHLLCLLALADTPATTQPSVRGIVKAESEVPLSEMVVYLEPTSPETKFDLPHDPVKVSQKGAKFAPQMLIICAGQTVDFLNDEDRPIEHNVFSNAPAKRFDLGLYKPGESRTVTFDKPGAVFLYCSIHRYMDGVIYVAPSPYFSRVNPDGSYSMDHVPPGKWTLKTWQRRKRFPEQTVPLNLEQGKGASIDLELKKR